MSSSVPQGGALAGLTKLHHHRTARVSSWDQSGRNQDAWVIPAGERVVLADIPGPGAITHIWMTQACRAILGPSLIRQDLAAVGMMTVDNALGVHWEVTDPEYYRKVVLRMYWDDQETPSVVAPLGDFFGLMNSLAGNYQSEPLVVSVKDDEHLRYGGAAALSCYFQMPFNTRARIEVENQGELDYIQYFYVDYELYPEPLADDVAYFHAHWRRSFDQGWAPDLQVNSPYVNIANDTGADNYVILDTRGRGHYVGCVLAVHHFQGTWWGEGDDMIFVDGEPFPPRYHGTGGEDYFGHAWGMQHNAAPTNGTIVHQDDVPGIQHSYRFHLTNPVRFETSVRVTMEHGHGNHLGDDWSSTAYWYQTLPSPRLDIPPVEQRLPIRPQLPVAPTTHRDAERHAAVRERAERDQAAFERDRDAVLARRAADARDWSRANAARARALRADFDAANGGLA